MKNRLVLRSFILSSIPVGLAAWILLPPLFSLLIILTLSYLDEHFIEALQAKDDHAPPLKEAQDQKRGEIGDSASSDIFEAIAVKSPLKHSSFFTLCCAGLFLVLTVQTPAASPYGQCGQHQRHCPGDHRSHKYNPVVISRVSVSISSEPKGQTKKVEQAI
jgi:hypothetical protein